jgi:hypothetical protein
VITTGDYHRKRRGFFTFTLKKVTDGDRLSDLPVRARDGSFKKRDTIRHLCGIATPIEAGVFFDNRPMKASGGRPPSVK